jgi:hypothetical protein
MMKFLAGLTVFLFLYYYADAQVVSKTTAGIISGNILDSASSKAIAGANVQLINIADNNKLSRVSTKEGEFFLPEYHSGITDLQSARLARAPSV